MMRTAELTVQNGFRYFTIVSEKDISRHAIEKSVSENDERILTRKEKKEAPGVELMIRCYGEEPSSDAIDARDFLIYNPVKK